MFKGYFNALLTYTILDSVYWQVRSQEPRSKNVTLGTISSI